MKKQHPVVERSRERLAALGHIESRTQFGGYALAVEKVVFALISDDALYLRASEALREYAARQPMQPLVFRKRGASVSLDYYRVDDALWRDAGQLLALSAASLDTARQASQARERSSRLKDLPNLSLRMELLLHEAGVKTVRHLLELGAKQCWLRLRAINQHVGLKTLLALEGAIEGRHEAALPQAVRAELNAWYQETLKASTV
ncbi:TfoX/Sxy family DNA transformation protein [Candidatus Pantoea deserta]|uniref:TfoX/Sxy family DNA transformation protein n=1 Tax=Candidatus Pantoea deserta TaxID=1869313 RepID=A0A3N4NIY7_9GAMM|nr:TfoX/Sxy family DNA transformation protein [Pantoea deserta]RPD96362.1 TfoX/Sxy family DNA transformation protein [Pantoea deserta]